MRFRGFLANLFNGQFYRPRQNIWNKIEKSNKIGQDKKILISTFVCFITTLAKI